MPVNRKKLIDHFIGNISNAIVHEILVIAKQDEEIVLHYRKEIEESLDKSKKYREKINPVNTVFPEKDIENIRHKIINKVRNELMQRISKGYENIDLNLVEELVDKVLKEMKVL